MRPRISFFGTISLLATVAGGCKKAPPAPEQTPETVAAAVGVDVDAAVAVAADAGSTVMEGDKYIGAVGGLPVHAVLTVSDSAITGRWFYEKGGGAEGLAVDTRALGTAKGHYVGSERIADGGISGDLLLDRRGVELTGSWSKHADDETLFVILAPEIRSKVGGHVVRAKRVKIKSDTPGATVSAGFLPIVEGADASRIRSSLTFKALLGDEETELVGGTITALDFDVVLDDARLLTLAITEETMGAYPSSNRLVDTFDWTTGKKIGAEAFAEDQRAALVKQLDKRVQDAWNAKKRALAKLPEKPGECGPDIAHGFMDSERPPFTAAMLDGVSAKKDGLAFDFDFGFPHVIQACSPEVDLSMPWKDAKGFVDQKGPFGGR